MPGSGIVEVDFGAFPGTPEKTVDVTGQSGFVATSELGAWKSLVATTGGTNITNHSVDEHVAEEIEVEAYYKVDGTFTLRVTPRARSLPCVRGSGAERLRLFGRYNVAWAWA